MTENCRSVCAMILSDKSSGSSMLQRELAKHPDVNVVRWTRHQENETLYWNKAAIVMGLPHENLYRSEMPIPHAQARDELVEFLENNLSQPPVITDDGSWVFEGWRALCEEYGPVFLEKSPHHIHSKSALTLIEECSVRFPDISFRYIGLVRNPISTLYSMWKRWKIHPSKKEEEWSSSYRMLLSFSKDHEIATIVIKYEDIVKNKIAIDSIFEHIGVSDFEHINSDIHSRSVDSWKRDQRFRWTPSAETVEVASALGYSGMDLETLRPTVSWAVTSRVSAFAADARFIGSALKKRIRGR